MYARLKHMYHTEAWYQENDPATHEGELFFTAENPRVFKLGDGVSRWSELPYAEFVPLTAGGKADPGATSARIGRMDAPSSGTATIELASAGSAVYVASPAGTTVTVMVPADGDVAFPAGTEIEVIQEGEGTVVFAASAGVTLHSYEETREIAGRYAGAALRKIGANDWRLAGELA